MTSHSPFWNYTRAIKYFASTRAIEVIALQASPLLGAFFGGFNIERHNVVVLSLLMLGSVALTSHVFVFNDWAGQSSDIHDPRRTKLAFTRRGIRRPEVARIAIALLIFANLVFAAISVSTILLGAAVATLSLLYSCSANFGKGAPIAASINHLLGGAFHFLLGYTIFHTLDVKGLAISIFFGLVFAGGHLNQEIRDYEGDRLNGIRTSAVVFGCRRTFLGSLSIFTAAYAVLTVLAAFGILPRLLLLSVLVWSVHFAWSMRALRRGLGFETALWMQRRYRLLFAFIGLAMLTKR
jgi:4-hydroxybenzoate polyprenyltransferase